MKKPQLVRVSDHAVLRYLERAGGFDIEALRDEIARRVSPAVALGATGITIDGFSYRVSFDERGPVIATVIRVDGNSAILRCRAAGE